MAAFLLYSTGDEKVAEFFLCSRRSECTHVPMVRTAQPATGF